MQDVNLIRDMRKKLGLTQKELALTSRVSQSLIAKIESSKIDPAYSKVQKIFSALESLSRNKQQKASDLMIKQIIKIKPSDTVRKAIQKMKRYNISQMPVFNEKQVVGLISEMVILDAMTHDITPSTQVSDIMDEAPPTISPTADMTSILSLLKQFPLVIVSAKGTPRGVITKSDLVMGLNL